MSLFVENVLNPRFGSRLVTLGFTQVDDVVMPCYFIKATK